MTNPRRSLPPIRPELKALLQIAADLRDLPREELRERLRTVLSSPESEQKR